MRKKAPTERKATAARKRGAKKAKIVIDKITGFPVLSMGPGAPILTSEEVRKILADFP